MSKTTVTVNIQAPVENTFAYVSETTNLPSVWPSMVEVKDFERLPNGGARFRWVYKMLGMRLEGMSEDLEYVKNQRIVSKSSGGIDSTITWIFAPDGEKTKLALEAEYNVSIPLVGRVAEFLIILINERELREMLYAIKINVEKAIPPES